MGNRSGRVRILVELNSADLRIGAVNDALDLAELTREGGAELVLCGPITPALREEAARRGAETIEGSSRTFSRRALPLYGLDVLRWMQRLSSIQPDVVHLNYAGYGPSLACAARACGIPVVGRAGPYVASNPANGWISTYFANCHAHAAELLESPLASRVVVAGDLFRPARLDAGAAESPRPLPPKPPRTVRLLFLGQLVERKGIHVLVDALSRLDRHLAFDAILAGGDWSAPGYPQDVKALASRLDVAARIHFENHRPDIGALLRDADVFVLPSLSEARPRSIIEAMALGRPVVGSDAGGIPSLVQHWETGMLATAGDPDALAAALTTLLSSPELRARMGAAGKARAEQDCRADRTAAVYLDTYRRVAFPSDARLRVAVEQP